MFDFLFQVLPDCTGGQSGQLSAMMSESGYVSASSVLNSGVAVNGAPDVADQEGPDTWLKQALQLHPYRRAWKVLQSTRLPLSYSSVWPSSWSSSIFRW